MTSTVQDHAIIGDGRSCALFAKTELIVSLCSPGSTATVVLPCCWATRDTAIDALSRLAIQRARE
jgi:hypothetical protein